MEFVDGDFGRNGSMGWTGTKRAMGKYYEDPPPVTSYNEWGERTQIEPAFSSPASSTSYQTYGGNEKLFIELTVSDKEDGGKVEGGAGGAGGGGEECDQGCCSVGGCSRLRSLIMMKYGCEKTREGGRVQE
eukprot:749784-Hanusia_phi.AAC.1